MSSGLKIWLWIVLVLNSIGVIFSVLNISLAPTLIFSVILGIVSIIGIILLLFQQKKLGFYIMCVCNVIAAIINIINGTNLILALLSAVFVPGITYLIMKNNWNEFE